MSELTDRLSAAVADRYQIESQLGEGGMATVYLAEDLRHERKVALKVLKPELAAVLGADRFIQEIKTTASLQHPHILPLFDSGQADGFLYYVMPYVEGETLREKLDRETQLGIDEAIRITTEVADALDYAHRNGVIHRDIKPENILLHDGRPMVADFGIALAVSAAAGGRMTETGLSLGTPHYMSPEQATAEKDITSRSDIYSLGAVLYEMLTGNPPHLGASAQQIIMKIVTEEAAPVTRVRKSVPPNVTAAVGQALGKLPADRFESAKAFAEALADPNFTAAGLPGTVTPAVTVGGWMRSPLSKVAVAAVAAFAAATAWLGAMAIRDEGPPKPEPVIAFQLMDSVPGGLQFTQANDGTIAYRWDGRIFVRRPGDVTASAISDSGPQWVGWPLLAPDGGDIAYIEYGGFGSDRRSGIRRVSLRGGSSSTIFTLAEQTFAIPLAWSEDGWIYVSHRTGDDATLVRLRESGGEVKPIVNESVVDAIVLPGGKWLVGCVRSSARTTHIMAIEVATGDTARIMDDACSPRWSPTGHLLVPNQDGTVRAVPFDARRLRVTGPPTPVLDDVVVDRAGRADYELGPSGTLLYVTGRASEGGQMALLDLKGERSPIPLPPTYAWDGSIAPDGRRLAYSRDGQIWIYDMNLGTHWSLAATGASQSGPIWSPDGTRIAYRATGTEANEDGIYIQALSGDSVGVYIGDTPDGVSPSQWLPDGTILAHSSFPGDIVALSADAPGPATELLRADWDERGGWVSPDGSWLVYVSSEAGRFQLTVRAWPALDRKAVIADSVEFWVPNHFWSPDGRTLYYLKRDRLMAAALAGTDSLRVASRRVIADSIDGIIADLHPDGRRFLIYSETAAADTSRRLIAVTGWLSVLRERLAGSGR